MDHREKLAWAAKQLESFDSEIDTWVEKHPFAVRKEIDCEAKRIRILANPSAPVPRHWPLVIGDVIHNTRSSLDYLTWELSCQAPTPPNEIQMRDIQFPICMWHGEYFGGGSKNKRGKREQRLRFVSPLAQAVIDGLQPHLRGNDAKYHPLAILNEMANIDKHREILLTTLIGMTPHISFIGLGVRSLTVANIATTARVYEPDAELGVIDFPDGLPPNPEMQVTPHPTGAIVFDLSGPAGGSIVVEFLERLHDYIRKDVFLPLESFLQ